MAFALCAKATYSFFIKSNRVFYFFANSKRLLNEFSPYSVIFDSTDLMCESEEDFIYKLAKIS